MELAYFEGDRVLTFNWIKVRVGDVIVFKTHNKYLIKRVNKLSSNKLIVEGDNKEKSSKVKPIAPQLVVGRVILKY